MTLGIAHRNGKIGVLDAIREVQPPFSPESVVHEFATLLKRYRISWVDGDRYAGEWVRELQTGQVQNYLLSGLVMLAVVLAAFVFFSN